MKSIQQICRIINNVECCNTIASCVTIQGQADERLCWRQRQDEGGGEAQHDGVRAASEGARHVRGGEETPHVDGAQEEGGDQEAAGGQRGPVPGPGLGQ